MIQRLARHNQWIKEPKQHEGPRTLEVSEVEEPTSVPYKQISQLDQLKEMFEDFLKSQGLKEEGRSEEKESAAPPQPEEAHFVNQQQRNYLKGQGIQIKPFVPQKLNYQGQPGAKPEQQQGRPGTSQ